jgi:hypothetical protein
MDGKGLDIDYIYIERFCRTLKRKHVYLNPEKDRLSFTQASMNIFAITIIKALISVLTDGSL